jgi:NitT/TauT family transport system substrate-binding protein
MSKIPRRFLLFPSFGGLVLACTALLAPADRVAAQTVSGDAGVKLAIPFNALSYDVTPLWVAVDDGLFRRYGIDATIAGAVQSPALVASVLSGETPYAVSGPDAVVSADLGGADIVILAAGPRVYFGIYGVPRIKTVSDLKGKKVGITQFGTTTDFITRYALKQAGLASADVTLLPLGPQQNVVTTLLAGRIDGAELAADAALEGDRASEAGKLTKLADVFHYNLFFYSASLIATKSWVKAHRDETLNVVRSYVAGIATVLVNKDAALAALNKYVKGNPETTADAYQMLIRVLQKDPMPRAEVLKTILAQSTIAAAKTADPASFIDASFLATLEHDGFIDGLYKR